MGGAQGITASTMATGGEHIMAQPLVKDLNIVIVRVTDIVQARAFYGDTLGFALVSEGPGFFSVEPFAGKGASLGVGVGESASKGGAEVWWCVDDADAFHAALVARGVRITLEPTDRPFGRAVGFTDPEGNQLYAYRPAAQQE
jgi:predicted enzyme related to lactoylglutathione lyase